MSPEDKTSYPNEFCSTCGYRRKHELRLLWTFRRFIQKPLVKLGRKQSYDPELLRITLARIKKVANLPCSKHLQAIIFLWMPEYVDLWPHFGEVHSRITGISSPPIDRILKQVRAEYSNQG